MNWYLRKSDTTVYGPVSLETLRRWAADGRVLPDDQVSEDQQSWRPAPDLPDLAMDWHIELAGGVRFGPLHLLAMATLVQDGAARGEEPITHRVTGEVWRLLDALLPALVAHCTALQDALDTRVPQLLMVPGPSAEEIAQREAAAAERLREASARADTLALRLQEVDARIRELENRPPDTSAEWKARFEAAQQELQQAGQAAQDRLRESNARADDLAQQVQQAAARIRELESRRDAAQTDGSSTWRAKYEAGQQALRESERAAEARIRELTGREAELARNLEAAERKVRQLQEEAISNAPARGVPGQENLDAASLLKSYNDLNRNYENLLERLRAKQEEHKAALAAIAKLEQDAAERTDHLETETEQERIEVENLRAQLAESQKNHQDLVRAYRDLNDRYIRLRQQSDAPAPAAGPTPPTAVPPRGGGPEKPRVRLV
jgi:hypothetical protein